MRRLRGRTTDGGAAGVSLELGRGSPHGPAGELRLTDLEAGAGACTGGRQRRRGKSEMQEFPAPCNGLAAMDGMRAT